MVSLPTGGKITCPNRRISSSRQPLKSGSNNSLIPTNHLVFIQRTHTALAHAPLARYIYIERDRVEEKKNLDGLITDARNMPPEESSKHRLLGRKRPAPCSLAVGRCQLVNLSASTAPSGKFVRVDPKKNLQHGKVMERKKRQGSSSFPPMMFSKHKTLTDGERNRRQNDDDDDSFLPLCPAIYTIYMCACRFSIGHSSV